VHHEFTGLFISLLLLTDYSHDSWSTNWLIHHIGCMNCALIIHINHILLTSLYHRYVFQILRKLRDIIQMVFDQHCLLLITSQFILHFKVLNWIIICKWTWVYGLLGSSCVSNTIELPFNRDVWNIYNVRNLVWRYLSFLEVIPICWRGLVLSILIVLGGVDRTLRPATLGCTHYTIVSN